MRCSGFRAYFCSLFRGVLGLVPYFDIFCHVVFRGSGLLYFLRVLGLYLWSFRYFVGVRGVHVLVS